MSGEEVKVLNEDLLSRACWDRFREWLLDKALRDGGTSAWREYAQTLEEGDIITIDGEVVVLVDRERPVFCRGRDT